MRIRMLVQMPAGATRNGEPWPALGEAAELPAADAAHLIASGVAEEAPADEPRRRRKSGTEAKREAT
ncbi:hypothetical protein JS756_03115 [Streptomyces actuosus]|uniref:Uncharacterized protein n=1 Tax=Streptomyces actuosus TaxID=1885 RepID=A0ABS2VJ42_STRAS|nr:hypothetical protein [Streptomyces actuosus]MBN0043120.1 hypothetical protein [Streptomyces actuosus]